MPGKARTSTCWKSTCESAVPRARARAPSGHGYLAARDEEPPAAVSTTSRPSGAMPRAVPAVSPTLTARPQRASRAESPACSGARPPRPSDRRLPRAWRGVPRAAARARARPRRGTQGRRRRASIGRQLASAWLTFRPIPRTTACSRASARTPATLRPSTSTSFGHLMPAERPSARSTVSAVASPPTSDSSAGCRRTGGRRRTEQRIEVPEGASQARPSRPRPAACCSHTATAPFGQVRCERSLRRVAANRVEVGIARTGREEAAQPRPAPASRASSEVEYPRNANRRDRRLAATGSAAVSRLWTVERRGPRLASERRRRPRARGAARAPFRPRVAA